MLEVSFLQFLADLANPHLGFLLRAVIISVIAAITCGFVGSFVVVRGMAFIGDAVSHAVFPGLAIAFSLQVSLLLGGAVAGVVVAILIALFIQRRNLREDSIIGVFFAASFALGMVIISRTQGYTSSLSSFLFGSLTGVSTTEVIVAAIVSALLTVVLFALRPQLTAVSLDKETAQAMGLPVVVLDIVLYLAVTAAIVISVSTIGNILVLALLITPAATARLLCRSLTTMMILAAAIGALGAITGIYVAWAVDLPGGATIVLTLTAAFIVVWLLHPIVRKRQQFIRPALGVIAATAALSPAWGWIAPAPAFATNAAAGNSAAATSTSARPGTSAADKVCTVAFTFPQRVNPLADMARDTAAVVPTHLEISTHLPHVRNEDESTGSRPIVVTNSAAYDFTSTVDSAREVNVESGWAIPLGYDNVTWVDVAVDSGPGEILSWESTDEGKTFNTTFASDEKPKPFRLNPEARNGVLFTEPGIYQTRFIVWDDKNRQINAPITFIVGDGTDSTIPGGFHLSRGCDNPTALANDINDFTKAIAAFDRAGQQLYSDISKARPTPPAKPSGKVRTGNGDSGKSAGANSKSTPTSVSTSATEPKDANKSGAKAATGASSSGSSSGTGSSNASGGANVVANAANTPASATSSSSAIPDAGTNDSNAQASSFDGIIPNADDIAPTSYRVAPLTFWAGLMAGIGVVTFLVGAAMFIQSQFRNKKR